MSERYTRLFVLEENLYSEGSPIVISAGALLKDNRTGGVLAQLKIKNISRKVIKAAIVCLTAYDAFGKIIDGTVEKEYLDLAVERDAEFGQKVLIPLPNAAARAFTAAVTCVGFADNTVWNYAGEEQAALPKTASISEVLGDDELVKQYRMKYGAEAKSVPQRCKDVWFCTCGELNHTDEEACNACGRRIAELLPLDLEVLIAEKDDRLKAEIEERRQAEERQRLEREEAERVKREEAGRKAKKERKQRRDSLSFWRLFLLPQRWHLQQRYILFRKLNTTTRAERWKRRTLVMRMILLLRWGNIRTALIKQERQSTGKPCFSWTPENTWMLSRSLTVCWAIKIARR